MLHQLHLHKIRDCNDKGFWSARAQRAIDLAPRAAIPRPPPAHCACCLAYYAYYYISVLVHRDLFCYLTLIADKGYLSKRSLKRGPWRFRPSKDLFKILFNTVPVLNNVYYFLKTSIFSFLSLSFCLFNKSFCQCFFKGNVNKLICK